MGNDVRLSRLDEGLNHNGGRCKQIKVEQERVRSFMIDSDDLPMIFVDLLETESGKLETRSLIFGSES